MSLAPSGPLSSSLVAGETILAACAAFQSWVGAEDAAEAKTNIHLIAADIDNWELPAALIRFGDDEVWSLRAEAGGSVNHFVDSGELTILIEAAVSEQYADRPRDAELEFANNLGAVIEDLTELAGSGAYLHITSIRISNGPARASKKEANASEDYYQAVLKIEWGL